MIEGPAAKQVQKPPEPESGGFFFLCLTLKSATLPFSKL